jgi:hypothetical protein
MESELLAELNDLALTARRITQFVFNTVGDYFTTYQLLF